MRGVAIALMLLLPLVRAAEAAPGPRIVTSDVDRFYGLYDAENGHPSADRLQRDYLDPGTDALHQFAQQRQITGASLAAAIAKHPETFSGARRCVSLLPAIQRRLVSALAKLAVLYPDAKFPPITIAIGRANTGGSTSADGVLIGLETLCAADYIDPNPEDRFVHLITHEYGHVQQPAAQKDDPNTTVLFASLIEGGAELVAELASGSVSNIQLKTWTKGHEQAIENAFAADEDSTDLSKWLYNGAGTPDHPGDLGYWVGYRIVKSYYLNAKNKNRALHDILVMGDPHVFLAESGWYPGMPLP